MARPSSSAASAAAAAAAAAGTSCSIFVGNVPYDAQEEELREIFRKVGNVTSVRVVCDKDTKQPKGYAFCDFSDSHSVQAAIDKLNNVEYNGRKLRIDWAERELHSSTPKPAEDRVSARVSSQAASEPLPIPVPTVADRLARLRDEEATEQARVAAADLAERAEIARLMETLTPQQVLHILGEMQRLALKAPDVARALISENMQLALALQHAQFLAGIVEEPPLPTEPGVTERAKNVREKIWGANAKPLPAKPQQPPGGATLAVGAPMAALPCMLMPPMQPAPGGVMVPFGAQPPPPMQPPPMQPQPPRPLQQRVLAQAPAMAQRQEVAKVPLVKVELGALEVPNGLLALGRPGESQQAVLERLVQLTPMEIDALPYQTKVELLDFLQKLPAPSAMDTS